MDSSSSSSQSSLATSQPASPPQFATSNPDHHSVPADTLPSRQDKGQDNQVRLVVQQLRDMDRSLRLSIKMQQEAIKETMLAGNVLDDGGEAATGCGMVSAGA
ncbi:hypothetical protein E4U55_002421 [Claviceps digitariae]|nr:hypothetical protein E4U55_002421 [Claviceps digitariae]